MAEGEGFEPSKDITTFTRLAGGCTRPLCDPSKYLINSPSSLYRGLVKTSASLLRRAPSFDIVDSGLPSVATRAKGFSPSRQRRMVRPEGVEPPTYGFVVRRSIH